MSQLEASMAMIIAVFQEHASKAGDKFTLTKGEVKELLQTQFKGLLEGLSDPAEVDKLFQTLDANADNVVDFQEFMITVAGLTMMIHKFFMDDSPK